MNYTINTDKNIRKKDVNEIFAALNWHICSDENWDKIIEKSTFLVQILKDERTIGFGRTLDDTRMCMIYDIVVHPDFQHQGIGKMIMDEILKYVQSQSFETVSLFYWEENQGVDQFYEKCGFYKLTNAMRLKK